jgi:hypothetical protein
LQQPAIKGYSGFIEAVFGLALRTQSENETRYIQYAVGEIDKVPNTYCKTIV